MGVVERAARRLDVILTHEAVQGEVCGRCQEQIRRGAGDREMFAERHRANAVDSGEQPGGRMGGVAAGRGMRSRS